jgi:hypothetical protein
MKKSVLSIMLTALLSAAAIGGCNSNDRSSDEQTSTGASMALTASDGTNDYCVSGDIEIYADNNSNGVLDGGDTLVGAAIETDCGDMSHEVILLPGDYLVTVDDPVCTSSLPNLEDCEMDPDPMAFSVTVGAVTSVPLAFIFSFENEDDQSVVFSVGSAEVSILPPENQERCGEGSEAEVCDVGQVCASVDGGGYACYDNCSTNLGSGGAGGAPPVLECGVDTTCTPVGVEDVDDRATNPASIPEPLVIGEEGALADTLWLCVPDEVGAGGQGGSAGGLN